MSCLAWNCRGLGKAPTRRDLGALTRRIKPDCLFLIECKISKRRIETVGRRLEFSYWCVVEGEGKAGGIELFWRIGVEISVIKQTKECIFSMVSDTDRGTKWLLICGHCPCSDNGKQYFWE